MSLYYGQSQYNSLQKTTGDERLAYIGRNASFAQQLDDNLSQCPQVINPLNETAFFVKWCDSIGFDV